MEQFNLDTWLKDKSRKVIIREGRQVRIVCYDLKCNTPIIAAIQWNQEREDCYCYNTIGRCANNVDELDLFFADNENELTEFEKELVDLVSGWCDSHIETPEEYINKHSKKLLDLARKELQPEFDKEMDKMLAETYKVVYQKGKQDVLKDLPKWKKAEKDEELDCHVAIQQDDRVVLSDFVQKDEYYITLDVLKNLQNEE